MSPALTTLHLDGLIPVRSGKVRELYDLEEGYLIVATDRISAFDCILPNGIPDKGKILTQLSAWWFSRFGSEINHHVLSTDVREFPARLAPYQSLLEGRSMLVRKTKVLPVECVARGYLIGSGWKEYAAGGSVCGLTLRPGYQLADRLDQPIFTPATKADEGHDENITYERMVEIVGSALAAELKATTLALYRKAADYAQTRGILLADTKFEFGIDAQGQLRLIDEILTPDSSRYWPADHYQPGSSPASYDKQFVRDYLESLTWDKQPPAPILPETVVLQTRNKYLEAFERLTGKPPEL
ncbi:MAG: phosphoribosylaminoimidazolesuccinocarboxamide synthase [Verrucomicrobia bacterium]|nr:phosphoribosylaminoimidazolesuccinocarboxamide synthase [Kiritimatiellia bacterium]MCP5488286.1 phosphoribosylaminoimidazolesuccinocarboxamide synthase [Verrucomicrobiota bacterium]